VGGGKIGVLPLRREGSEVKSFRSYVAAGVGFAMLVTIIMLVTGWGSAVAANVSSVFVTNTASNPVPVTPTGTVPVHEQGTAKTKEQNVDADGNVKVHEQGTANVNVTNSSLAVTPQAPITDGGGSTGCSGAFPAGNVCDFGGTETASVLSIHMTDGVGQLQLGDGHAITGLIHVAASFEGPNGGGNSTIIVALPRPVSFQAIWCSGSSGDFCSVSWVGDSP